MRYSSIFHDVDIFELFASDSIKVMAKDFWLGENISYHTHELLSLLASIKRKSGFPDNRQHPNGKLVIDPKKLLAVGIKYNGAIQVLNNNIQKALATELAKMHDVEAFIDNFNHLGIREDLIKEPLSSRLY